MAGMGGGETTRRIRAELPVSRQPRIVAVTGHALTENRQIHLDAGTDNYLAKPLRADQLVALLRRTPRLPQS